MKIHIFFLLLVFASCTKTKPDTVAPVAAKPLTVAKDPIKQFGKRYIITGDFNGDRVTDTIRELYVSSITGEEIDKIQDTVDWENNFEMIIKLKPETYLKCSIKNMKAFVVSDDPQSAGVYNLSNLGDLNDDGTDEFGYQPAHNDFSSMNRYYIMTIKNKLFKELFSFEMRDIDEATFNIQEVIKKGSDKTIMYRYEDFDTGFKTRRHKFN